MNLPDKRYALDAGLQLLFKDMRISAQDVFRHAGLPLDLMSRKSQAITAQEFFQLWAGLEHVLRDNLTFPVQFAEVISVESFSPPIFACLCSDNLNLALKRLAEYKPLIGPLHFSIEEDEHETTVVVSGLPENMPPSSLLIASELVFLVQIARIATREQIIPTAIHTTIDLPEIDVYEEFFGTTVTPEYSQRS